MTRLRSPIHGPIRSLIYSPLVGKWGGGYDASLFGPADDGFLHNLSQTSLLAQNSNGTTPVAADSDPIGWAKSTVASQRIATQATTSARPFWKTPNFSRFDGADDNWLTTFNPTAAMTLAAKFKLTSGNKGIIGAYSSPSFAFLMADTSGILSGGAGGQSQATIKGGSDIRGNTGVGIIAFDASTVRLYWNGVLVYTGAFSGTPYTAVPLRVGALNNAGTAVLAADMDLYNALAINRALSPAEVTNLTNYWNAQ